MGRCRFNSTILTWAVLCLLLPSLSKPASAAEEGLQVLASFYPIQIAAMNLTAGAPGVAVGSLAAASAGCLHDYQLTAADMRRAAEADILIINGAGMEEFAEGIRKQRPELKVIDASRGIELLSDEHGPNPHLWLSPALHIRQVENIARELQQLDPVRADVYHRNAVRYTAQLEDLRRSIEQQSKVFRNHSIITFHEAFVYFAKEFGLRIAGVVEAVPGADPSPRDLAELSTTIRKEGVRAVFTEPQYSSVSAEIVARETGVKLLVLDPLVTGPLEKDAYIKGMTVNVGRLREALE